MDRWKSRGGKSERREEQKREKQRRERARRKKMQVREKDRKGRKVAIHCVFPMICGSGGTKSRLAKAAGAEPCGQMRDEQLHAIVARSRFPSQNVQNTPGSEHFLKLRCRKSARRCGAKHNWKSKCTEQYKTHQVRSTFWSWDVEKVHAAVARSTFRSQKIIPSPNTKRPPPPQIINTSGRGIFIIREPW